MIFRKIFILFILCGFIFGLQGCAAAKKADKEFQEKWW